MERALQAMRPDLETAEGRVEYEAEQRRLSAMAEPIRARLIAELERALA